MTIESILADIGLNTKEIKIYLTLLKNGKSLPSTLSRLTKINRASVYSTAKGLLAKGIIAEDMSGKTLYLSPLPIENLMQLVEKPKRELDEKADLIKKAVNELSFLTADKKYPVPKIRFVEESDVEDFLYTHCAKWNKEIMKSDGIWWGFQDPSFVEHYEKWIDWTWKQKDVQNQKFRVHLLSNITSKIEQKMRTKRIARRDIRPLPGLDFTSSIWVAGDYLIMITTRQHPFYILEIHDHTLAHNMREVFKKLWSLTEVK